MAGKIFPESFTKSSLPKSCYSPIKWGRYRFYSSQLLSNVNNRETPFPNVSEKQLQTREIKFIGSDKLRRSTPEEIQKDPTLLAELGEAYEMLNKDDVIAKTTDFCTRNML